MIALLAALAAAGELRFGEASLPATIDPLAMPGTAEERLGTLVYDRLFVSDRDDGWVSRVVELDGAALRVRRGVRWQDHLPVTAEDVCFSVRTVLDPRAPPWWRGPTATAVRGCAVRDGVVTLDRAPGVTDDALRAALSIPLLSKQAYAGRDPWFDSPVARSPLGSGPYRATRTDDGWSFRGHGVPVRRLAAVDVAPDLSAVQALEGGRLAGLIAVPPPWVSEATAADDLNLRWYDRRLSFMILLDVGGGPTADARVREALDLALDREGLRAALIGVDPDEAEQPCRLVSGPFPARSPLENRGVTPTPHDPERAARLLREAGWLQGAEGWTRDGAPLVVRLAMPSGLELDAGATLDAVARDWEALGVHVEARALSTAGYARLLDRQLSGFDAVIAPWVLRTDDPGALVGADGWSNPFGWEDAEAGRLLAELRATGEPTAAWALHGLIAEQRPALFLWQWSSWTAWSDVLAHTPLTPGTYFGAIEEWSLEK